MRKYIPGQNGALVLNPEWLKQNPGAASNNTLPVLSTPDELVECGARIPKPLQRIIDTVQGAGYTDKFSLRETNNVGEQALNGLTNEFQQKGIPVGLLGHAVALRHYDLCFLIDDSGSMANPSDLPAQYVSSYVRSRISGSNATRWQDAEDRLHQMIDLLAYIPTGPIALRFLNSTRVIVLDHRGKTFKQFKQDAHQQIVEAFTQDQPHNRTPLYERMSDVINAATGKNQPTAFYVMTDGMPNGDATDIADIQTLLLGNQGRPNNRRGPWNSRQVNTARVENAQLFPVTFIDCTNDPTQTEWTRELEEESEAGNNMLYVAAVEDYIDESRQVIQFQGRRFPYNRGLWLLACMVAALDPNGLDAMDQPEPLTKSVVDCLMGRVHSEAEYRSYFESHGYAMRFFAQDYELFLHAQNEGEIPSVIEFRRTLSNSLRQDIEEDDDNSELREIENAGNRINSLRANDQFAAQNRELRRRIADRLYQVMETRGADQSVMLPATADTYAYPGEPRKGYIPQVAPVMGTALPGIPLMTNNGVIIPCLVEETVLVDLKKYSARKEAEYLSARFFRDTHSNKWRAARALQQFIQDGFVLNSVLDKPLLAALLEDHGIPRGASDLRTLAIRTLGLGNVLELDALFAKMQNGQVVALGRHGMMEITVLSTQKIYSPTRA